MASDFKVWKRKEGFGPGHARIYVLVRDDGTLMHPGHADHEVQCSTLERIPFAMKRKRLLEVYEPEPT